MLVSPGKKNSQIYISPSLVHRERNEEKISLVKKIFLEILSKFKPKSTLECYRYIHLRSVKFPPGFSAEEQQPTSKRAEVRKRLSRGGREGL